MTLFVPKKVLLTRKPLILCSKSEQMKEDDYDFNGQESMLIDTSLKRWQKESCMLRYSAIMICESGSGTLAVNFRTWKLVEDSVIVVFPNDVVMLSDCSDDFTVRALLFTPGMLREASLQLESVVYEALRKDRFQTDSPRPRKLIKLMFASLSFYFAQDDCTCLSQLVLLQLKGFFLGFYDYLMHHPSDKWQYGGAPRATELFQLFHSLIERDFKENRDVNHYAALLHITPKYLNAVSHAVTKLSSKTIIDHYAILQLKLLLRSSQKSIKEIAWEYNFSNFSFFCRYFKRHTGQTPQSYRKENKSQ